MLTPQINLLEIEHQHVCEIIRQVFYRILGGGEIDAIRCGPRQI